MFKKILATLAMLFAATLAFAAADANKASQADLEAIKGIGPAISGAIIAERKKGEFKDWNDMVTRVKGVGDKNAAKFSEAGLTVNGAAFAGAPAKADAAPKSTGTKVVEKTKDVAEKAASGVKGAAKVVKEDAKEQKDAVKQNVADAKTKREEKKAAKAEAKAEKAEKAASAPKK